RHVAADHVPRLAARRQQHGVRPVLAAALDVVQEFGLLESVATVLRANAVQSALVLLALVDDDIETIERPQKTVRLAEGQIELLDPRWPLRKRGLTLRSRGAERRRRDAVERAVLVGDDQPALRIDANVDPRTLH